MEMEMMRDAGDDDEEVMVDIDGEDLQLPLQADGGWVGAEEAILGEKTEKEKEWNEDRDRVGKVENVEEGRKDEEENRVLDCTISKMEEDGNEPQSVTTDKDRYMDGRQEDEEADRQGDSPANPVDLFTSGLSPEPEVECSLLPDRIRKRPMSSIFKVLPSLTQSKGHLTCAEDIADVILDTDSQRWGLDARMASRRELEEEDEVVDEEEDGKGENVEKDEERNTEEEDEEEEEEVRGRKVKADDIARSSCFSIEEILKPEFGVVRQPQHQQPTSRIVNSTRLIGDCILSGMMLQRRHLHQHQQQDLQRRPGRPNNPPPVVYPNSHPHQSSPLLHPLCNASPLMMDGYPASAAAAASAVIHPLYLSSARERGIQGASDQRKLTARSTALRLQGLINNNNNNSNNTIDNSRAYCYDERVHDCIGEITPTKHLSLPQGPKHPLHCHPSKQGDTVHMQQQQRRSKHPVKNRLTTGRIPPPGPLLDSNAPARYVSRGSAPTRHHSSGLLPQPIQAELSKDMSDRSCVSTPSSTVEDGVLCSRESSSSSSSSTSSSSSSASSSAAENGARHGGASGGGSASGGEPGASSSSMPWPAWVYCTRYSDRPSSGPRCRKNKKKERSPDEKRPRTAFTNDQLGRLKREFDDNKYLTEERRQALARELALNESQIKIWFQNKRAKMKKASGVRNSLALQLMAQGLYNHSSVTVMSR